MEKKELKDLSKEELKRKEKSLKSIIILCIPVIIGLFYFVLRDYFDGKEIDFAILTIAICTIGGPATVYPELKKVQDELKTRSN
ncbi:hypothetical protein [Maribacter sp. IgM3_T14_3]|uniref:hypothetical protein n=1 Tax=Maribacter sp. IgM3_T14_3 TaxID=3415140 RepID=UPI003C6FDF29